MGRSLPCYWISLFVTQLYLDFIFPIFFFEIFFFKIFWCGPFFKIFIEFVTILLLFYVLVFWPQGMLDLSSLTRDPQCTTCLGRQNLNHWTTREVLWLHASIQLPSTPAGIDEIPATIVCLCLLLYLLATVPSHFLSSKCMPPASLGLAPSPTSPHSGTPTKVPTVYHTHWSFDEASRVV